MGSLLAEIWDKQGCVACGFLQSWTTCIGLLILLCAVCLWQKAGCNNDHKILWSLMWAAECCTNIGFLSKVIYSFICLLIVYMCEPEWIAVHHVHSGA